MQGPRVGGQVRRRAEAADAHTQLLQVGGARGQERPLKVCLGESLGVVRAGFRAMADDGLFNPICRYKGYNKDLVDRFVNMGFDVDAVVEAFLFVGIDRNGGEDYELEEAYMGDITARLLGEQ